MIEVGQYRFCETRIFDIYLKAFFTLQNVLLFFRCIHFCWLVLDEHKWCMNNVCGRASHCVSVLSDAFADRKLMGTIADSALLFSECVLKSKITCLNHQTPMMLFFFFFFLVTPLRRKFNVRSVHLLKPLSLFGYDCF